MLGYEKLLRLIKFKDYCHTYNKWKSGDQISVIRKYILYEGHT